MRPVFTDYLCVSYDYATTRAFLLTLIFFDVITSSPLSFLFGCLPFRLSLDLFFLHLSFFHFATSYFLLAILYSRLLSYIIYYFTRLFLNSTSFCSFSLSSQFCSSFYSESSATFFFSRLPSV